jgi:hypothetical protein
MIKQSKREVQEQEWNQYIEYAITSGHTYPDVWESMEESRKNLWQYTTATTGLPYDEISRLCSNHMDKMEYVKKNWVAVEATIPKKSLLSRIISKISSE